MKAFLVLLFLIAAVNGFAAEVRGPYAADLEKYTVNTYPGEKTTLQIGKEEHFSCWKRWHYTTLKSDNKVVVLREALMHPMVVCNRPVRQTEGTTVNLPYSRFGAHYEIYVPESVELEVNR